MRLSDGAASTGSPPLAGRMSPEGPWAFEARVELESDPVLMKAVRLFVDEMVTEWKLEMIRDDARLVATELATNAVLHARTELRVTLRSDGAGLLRVEVRDLNTRMPSPSESSEGATSGRGLAVVSALAWAWGAHQEGDAKVVWAELGRRPSPEDARRVVVAPVSSTSTAPTMPVALGPCLGGERPSGVNIFPSGYKLSRNFRSESGGR